MPPGHVSLSKSKLTAYLQCRKRLWLEIHRPELRADSATSKAIFAAGHQVGELAREEYPGGVMIGPADPAAPIDWPKMFAETDEALRLSPRRPIFEATCRHEGVLVRADILVPVDSGWHMAEVKSSTGVKDYHVDDVAVQTWVMRGAGVEVRSVEVRHVDSGFVYPGSGRYAGLFRAGDVQREVEERQPDVPRWIEEARAVAANSEPAVAIGKHCRKPFACPFETYCTGLAGPQPEFPVTMLPGNAGRSLARRLTAEGFTDLRAVPPDRVAGTPFAAIADATRCGTPYHDVEGARAALGALTWPRYYFDFETIALAVPIWAGTRPYEKQPFQWSCHVEQAPGEFEHHEFVDLGGEDPTRACAEALIAALGTQGPILAYHASFEIGVLAQLGVRHPDLEPALGAIRGRFFDLERAVRDYYYHPAMRGSYSIKSVLPAIAPDLDYAGLDEVADGTAAMQAYVEAIAPTTPEDRRDELRRSLLIYCRHDTWAMVVVHWFLEGRGRPPGGA